MLLSDNNALAKQICQEYFERIIQSLFKLQKLIISITKLLLLKTITKNIADEVDLEIDMKNATSPGEPKILTKKFNLDKVEKHYHFKNI